MRQQKNRAHQFSIVVAIVLLIATIVINYLAGVSADDTYFGAYTWHYLAWVPPVAFLISLAGVWVTRNANPS